MIYKCNRCASEGGAGTCECGGTRLRVLETPEETIARLTRERDEALASARLALGADLREARQERDEARAERDNLIRGGAGADICRRMLARAEAAEAEVERLRGNYIIDCLARDEVERLRAGLRGLRGRAELAGRAWTEAQIAALLGDDE